MSRFSFADRLRFNKKRIEANEAAELAERERIRNSKFTDICTKIRWMFYIQIAISIGSFFYAPFKETDTVNYFERQTINAKGQLLTYRGIIKTFSEKDYWLTSRRFRDNFIFKGDTISVIRNVFYKVEGVKHKSSTWPYFLESKWVFCFVWVFLGAVAMFTESAKRSGDLRTRNRLSMLLLFAMIAYFIL